MAARAPVIFGDYALDRSDERLIGPDGPVRIGNKAYRVLCALIDAEGRLLTKDALFDTVWDGVIVSESALTSVIKELRRALGDESRQSRYIESVYGRGYRFIPSTGQPADVRPAATVQEDAWTPAGNLPRTVAPLIGREADLAAVTAHIAPSQLAMIVGPGGVGKSRLALEAARRAADHFAEGAWLIELAATTEADKLCDTVARALGLQIEAGQEPAPQIAERLRRRSCLIVLDNCEHLLAAVADLVETIQAAAPGLAILVTSQESLGVPGARVHRLDPLAEDDAIALFNARAHEAWADFAPEQERAAIAQICRLLDGIPLAIEMAAARSMLGCEAVLERLCDRFRLLTGARRPGGRHQTLRAALAWSHDLLDPRDARVFRRLAVFSGTFSLDAASAIAADEALGGFDVLDAVESLIGKSLLIRRSETTPPRFLLLETMRAYGLERLDEAGEADAFRQRHATHFAEFSEPVWQDFTGPVSDRELDRRYGAELENMAAAVDWAYGRTGNPEIGHRILVQSASLWSDRPLHRALDAALKLVGPETDPAIKARLLASRAHAMMILHPAQAGPVSKQAVDAMRRTSNDPWALCDALCSQGFAAWLTGDNALARRISDEVQALVPQGEPFRIGALAAGLEACVQLREHGPEASRSLFDNAVFSLHSIGAYGLASFWQATAMRFDPSDDPGDDIIRWRELLDAIRPGDMYADAMTSAVATELAARLAGRGEQEDLDEALAVARHSFNRSGFVFDYRLLLSLAAVARGRGRNEDAAVIFGRADADRQAAGEKAMTGSDFTRLREKLAASLGEAALARLARRGAAWSRQQVIDLALDEAAAELTR